MKIGMNRRARIWGAALAVALAISLIASTAVLAEGPIGWGRRLGSAGLEAIAELLGIDAEDLATQIWGGRTLADLADRAGVDLRALFGAAESAREEAQPLAIEKAVEEGKLTEEHAEWLREGVVQSFGARMPMAAFGRWLGCGRAYGAGMANEAIAEALGLSEEDLRIQLWGGRTLADLADRAGVELADVQAAVEAAGTEAMRERIAKAVEEGSISEEQADWLLEGLDAGYLDDGFGRSMACGRGRTVIFFGPRPLGGRGVFFGRR